MKHRFFVRLISLVVAAVMLSMMAIPASAWSPWDECEPELPIPPNMDVFYFDEDIRQSGMLYYKVIDDSVDICGLSGKDVDSNYYRDKTNIDIPETIDGYPVESISGMLKHYEMTPFDDYDSDFNGYQISIPKTVKTISDRAFGFSEPTEWSTERETDALSVYSIEVAADNPEYSSWKGDLYNKNCTVLLRGTNNGSAVNLPTTVKRIEKNACINTSITSVTIPESVTEIGDFAFYGSNLTSVKIPDSVTKLGKYAFGRSRNHEGSALTSVKIGKGLTKIDDYAFAECRSLNTIEIPSTVTEIGNYAFQYSALNSLILPDPVQKIGKYAFASNSLSSEVKLSSDLTEISEGAFKNCSMASIDIPASVAIIATSAFAEARYLSSVTFHDGLKVIEANAFSETALKTVRLPKSIQSLSGSAFNNIEPLTSVSVDSGCRYYSSRSGVVYDKDQTELVIYPKSKPVSTFTVPSTVKKIGTNAFAGAEVLQKLTMSDSVKELGPGAFASSSIKSVKLSASLKEIPAEAFRFSELEEIEIPSSVKRICKNAFASCLKLKKLTIPGSVKQLDESALQRCRYLDEIVLEEGVEYIGPNVFGQKGTYTNVTYEPTQIYLPHTVKEIDNWAFYNTNVVLHGYRDTVAEIFAKKHNMDFKVISESQNVKQIKDAQITLNTSSFTYDGNAKMPAPNVKYGDKTLKEKTDYVLDYNNNVHVGKADVTVIGIGGYTGSVSRSFTISPCKIGTDTVSLEQTSYPYSGTAITPEPTVTVNGNKLSKGSDYIISYSNNINVGKSTVTVTGKGDYTSSVSTTFNITSRDISDATVTVGSGDFEYDGKEKCPAVSVYDSGRTLTPGTDYKLSYSDNIKAGTATISVSGVGNYTGNIERRFTVTPKSLEKVILSVNTKSETDTDPSVTLKDGDKILERDVDYTCSVRVQGTLVTITVTGIGNYSKTRTSTYTLKRISLSDNNITLGSSSYTYDGTAKQPSVAVKVGSATLKKGVDYDLSYESNVDTGTAFAVVTGKGSYTGTVRKSFSIAPRSFTQADVNLKQSSFTYDGSAKLPAVSVSYNGKTLIADKDYRVTRCIDNVNAGTATAYIAGMGNYEGEVKRTFTIVPKAMSGVSISDISSLTYNGQAQTPEFTIRDGSKDLIEDIDYTVSAQSNINAGDGKLTVSGKGNYTGSVTRSFRIERASLVSADVTFGSGDLIYDGKEKKPSVYVRLNGVYLTEDTDYSLSYSDNVYAGTAAVSVQGKGNYIGSRSRNFIIGKKSIADNGVSISLSKTNYTADGTEKKPDVTVKDGSRELTLGTDYTVAYSNNINAGTAEVKVTGKGNYSGEKSSYFTIEKSKKGFTWGEDNLPFCNTPDDFGVKYTIYLGDDGYYHYRTLTPHGDLINSQYYNALYHNVTPSMRTTIFEGYPDWDIPAWMDFKWGGSCYGMAAVDILAHEGYIPLSEYKAGARGVNDFNIANKDMKVSSLITYYFMIQANNKIQDQYQHRPYYSYRSNIEDILSALKTNDMVMVGLERSDGYNGHSVVAYDYEKLAAPRKIGNAYYDQCIKICDPNAQTMEDPEYHLYFDSQYNWTIPNYTDFGSDTGGHFNCVEGSSEILNEYGYHQGSKNNKETDSGARLNAYELSENNSVEKVEHINGNFVSRMNVSQDPEIFKGILSLSSGEDEGIEGYNLIDGESAYRVVQDRPDRMTLSMQYEDSLFLAAAEKGEIASFERGKEVRISGEDSDYSLSITSDKDYPTDWYTISVSGNASNASLRMVDEGYILTCDDMTDVTVEAKNKDISAHTVFSSSSKTVLLYEIDEFTIGIREDSDGDGSFDSVVTTDTKSLASCDIKLSSKSFSYDGSEKKPTVTVTENGNALREGTDYKLSYNNLKGEGVAYVKVDGIGNYSGTLKANYYIEGSVKLGDVNDDKVVTAKDRALLARFVAKWKNTEISAAAADVNLDGMINALDRIILTRHIERNPSYTSLPV